ncbi:MAG: hypothetical protein H0V01_15250 [Bacteroidetes bacterium]|nr:hypothetical protein [Bacteroidota bacterium]HET6245909.1 hypothetical protein [Bacteroidia bacterium]
MEHRDYIQKIIDQLGKVLEKILGDLIGAIKEGQINQGIEKINYALKNEINMDIAEIIILPNSKLLEILQEEKKINNENLERLANILILIADSTSKDKVNSQDKKNMYEKCLVLYEHLEKNEKLYSFDRHLKIERLKTIV